MINKIFNDEKMVTYINCTSTNAYKKYGLAKFMELEDFKQEVKLMICEYIGHYDPSKSCIKTYIYYIAKTGAFKLLRYYRQEKRKSNINNKHLSDPHLEGLTLEDKLANEQKIEVDFINYELVDYLLDVTRNDEQLYNTVYLIAEGYNLTDICRIKGYKYHIIYKRIKKLQNEVKKYYKNFS